MLFTPAVYRDIYAVLLNPRAPGATSSAPSAAAVAAATRGRIPFEVSLVAKSSKSDAQLSPGSACSLDTFAFIDRPGDGCTLPSGWVALQDDIMLRALSLIGQTDPMALAATKAFEAYLTTQVANWGPAEAARLSSDFLVAFGNEMTPRLDVHHRIRSCKLSAQEVDALRASPAVDQAVLRTFQGAQAAVATNDVPPQWLALPAPHTSDATSAVTPTSMELPSLPAAGSATAYAALAPTPTSQLLFKKC